MVHRRPAHADVIAVRAEQDVLAAKRGVAAADDADHVARGGRRFHDPERAAERAPGRAGGEPGQRPAHEARSDALADVEVGRDGGRVARQLDPARLPEHGNVLGGRRVEPDDEHGGRRGESPGDAEPVHAGPHGRAVARGREPEDDGLPRGVARGEQRGGVSPPSAEHDGRTVEGARAASHVARYDLPPHGEGTSIGDEPRRGIDRAPDERHGLEEGAVLPRRLETDAADLALEEGDRLLVSRRRRLAPHHRVVGEREEEAREIGAGDGRRLCRERHRDERKRQTEAEGAHGRAGERVRG